MQNKLVKAVGVIYMIVFYGGILALVVFSIFSHPQTSATQNDAVNFTVSPTNAITFIPTKPNCLTSQQVSDHYNQYVSCIRYYVGHPFRFSNGSEILNERSDYWNGFSVFIPYSAVGQFGVTTPDGEDVSLDPVESYGYKWVDVSGYITPYYYNKYNFMPEIIISSPSQIRLTPEEEKQIIGSWK